MTVATEIEVFAVNDEYEPSLLDIVEAADAYRDARDRVARATRDATRDERHWRESIERMQSEIAEMQRAREALLRATGASPESNS